MMPQAPGSIFLGETFTSYLNIYNDGAEPALDVVLKVTLQTQKDQTMLSAFEANKSTRELGQGEAIGQLVKHEIKELGTHILGCTVAYRTPSASGSERKTLKKNFKFQVLKPLEVNSRTYPMDGDIYLEALIQNITTAPVFLQRVALQPNKAFIAVDLNLTDEVAPGAGSDGKVVEETTFGVNSYLEPQNTRQYLYRLEPVDNSANSQAATDVGRLDIVWRTNLGEMGRLRTNPLPGRKSTALEEVGTRVIACPNEVLCGAHFRVSFEAINRSAALMEIGLFEDASKVGNIVMKGAMQRVIGTLQPNESMMVHLDLIALSSGLQRISGIGLFDKIANKMHLLTALAPIFVRSHENY